MIKVTVKRDGWYDYEQNAWGGALTTLDEVVKQGREDEAVDVIENYFSEDTYGVLGYIPSATELNDFIWFDLPDIMHLYDNEDDGEDEEYEDEE